MCVSARVSHLLVMSTGAGVMSGWGGCGARQIGTPLSHDHSMACLMDTHMQGTQTHKHLQTDVCGHGQTGE